MLRGALEVVRLASLHISKHCCALSQLHLLNLNPNPIAPRPFPAADQLLKIVLILCVGMVATLLFTAQTAVLIRAAVKTENKEVSGDRMSIK
jgi:hypothetical protein